MDLYQLFTQFIEEIIDFIIIYIFNDLQKNRNYKLIHSWLILFFLNRKI